MRLLPALALIAALLPLRGSVGATTPASPASFQRVQPQVYGRVGLGFEPNVGQTDARVRYLARANGYLLFLTRSSMVFRVDGASSRPRTAWGRRAAAQPTASTRSSAVAVAFVHANPRAAITASSRLPGKVNYFLGNDPTRWRTDIPTYGRVEYHDLYPGIDLVYYNNGGRLEYDWMVHPGADLSRIQLRIAGPASVRELPGGALDLHLPTGHLLQRAPRAYQSVGGRRVAVSMRYELSGRGRVLLRAGRYLRSKTLTIDPVLAYSTYLGGKGADNGYGLTIDGAGDTYVVGSTPSSDFPAPGSLMAFHNTRNAGDVFVSELNPAGNSLVFSTYIGGSDFDQGYAVAVDSTGISVVGDTSSHDFPTVQAVQPVHGGGDAATSDDGFMLKLSPAGSRIIYSSYLGGSDDDVVYSVAADGVGNSYLAGNTKSGDFPTAGGRSLRAAGQQSAHVSSGGGEGESVPEGNMDAWAAKVSPSGSLTYVKRLGGGGVDTAYGIALDGSGDAYVVGSTQSDDFPVTPGAFQAKRQGPIDGFVTKIDPAGKNLVFSTHLGGNDKSVASAVTVDAAGDAYVAGQTSSTNFPMAGGFQQKYAGGDGGYFKGDAYVTKFDPSGNVKYSTYLGGSHDEEARGIAVDGSGSVYVTGHTDSADFPVKDALQPAFTGSLCAAMSGTFPCTDAFITKLDGAGQLVYSTYFGGSGNDSGAGIAVDGGGTAYVVGTTDSHDMETVNPLQAQNRSDTVGALDVFVAKLGPGATPTHDSIVIDRLQIFHKVKGKQKKTGVVKAGERARFVAVFHDTRGTGHTAVGMLVLMKNGHEIYQSSMFPPKGKSEVETTIQLPAKQKGRLTAEVAVISTGATTVKAISFRLKGH